MMFFHPFKDLHCIQISREGEFGQRKKQRPMFSQQQVKAMENEFTKYRYITENKRAELSSTFNLKTWFQNRRTKWRKDLKNKET